MPEYAASPFNRFVQAYYVFTWPDLLYWSGGTWSRKIQSAMLFDTEAEAKTFAVGLALRWVGVSVDAQPIESVQVNWAFRDRWESVYGKKDGHG